IKPLAPGKYTVKASYVGYQPSAVEGVVVSEAKTTYLENPPISLSAGVELSEVEVVSYKEPLIDPDTKSGGTVTREEFLAMPSKNINSVAATTAGVYQGDEGGALSVRGQRADGTAYFIDGQRVIGSASLPQQSIEQVSVITGGVPAQFGDATGGVVNITTRGPQSAYFGGVELITSELLDSYGYNFVGFSVGGPIWMKKDSANNRTPILGFILSGEAVSEKDPDPSAVPTYKVKDSVLLSLENTPLIPATLGQGFVRAAERIHASDLEQIKARQNVASRSLRLNAKLDFKPTQNLNLTFGGSVDYNNRHDYIYEYALFNPVNNPQSIDQTWRVYGRLTQKFGSAQNQDESEKSASNIKNAFYTLQVGYTKVYNIQQDDTHKDRLYDYGHIGKFTQYKSRLFLPGNVVYQGDTVFGYYQAAFTDSALTFEPGTANPLMANYTSQVYAYEGQENIETGDDVLASLGLLNGYRPSNVYSLWYNTGRQFNGYNITDNSQFRVFTNFSADVKDHAIQIGFEFEQRNERLWSVSPLDLWIRMTQLANYHLTQLDLENPILVPAGTYDAFYYNRAYDAASQRWFDKQVREKLGLAVNSTDWIDINSYDPDFFYEGERGLDMFSAEDLLLDGNNIVGYYGYDAQGHKLKSNPSFDDFFTEKDADGNYTRNIGAFRPIYMAGYIQDKFDFKDLKFNLGLRVDRFDANQYVLKDKYLLYEAATVGEVDGSAYNPYGVHPSNMGSDYVVYVNDESLHQIVGYRNGDRWYDAAGNELTDPKILAQSTTTGQITPWLLDPSNDDVTSKAFKDYEPQLNFMPRIAFAFPISDEANFFAHYDVLTQRPSTGYRLDPVQYLYMSSRQGQLVNNPDLKPQRTTDYELGFTQTLNERKNSALTLSAFYREMRNMIQTISVNYAYPVNYLTLSNIDFGTVKGFTVAYDLRRTGGVQLTASYTLQFADGTGSSATEQVGLLNSGQPNLRNLIPLDFDQRHALVTNVDYRFGSGSNYHGPVWKTKKKEVRVLDNVGANVVVRAGSGVPYSRQFNVTQDGAFGVAQRSTLKGSIHGSRLPWQVRMDLRIDKNVDLKWGGKKEDGSDKKMAGLNIYLQVLNVLNTKNVVSVYRYTGNANDDGYLYAASSQVAINSQTDPQSFIDLYNVKINNPGNYSIPRRIRLGVMLDF
ncbi:MAG: TonB-dependent receptor, partial [Bacteroidetes bacterium]